MGFLTPLASVYSFTYELNRVNRDSNAHSSRAVIRVKWYPLRRGALIRQDCRSCPGRLPFNKWCQSWDWVILEHSNQAVSDGDQCPAQPWGKFGVSTSWTISSGIPPLPQCPKIRVERGVCGSPSLKHNPFKPQNPCTLHTPAAGNLWKFSWTDAPLELPVPHGLPGTAAGPPGPNLYYHGICLAGWRGTAQRGKDKGTPVLSSGRSAAPGGRFLQRSAAPGKRSLFAWKMGPFLFFPVGMRWRKDKGPI